MDKLKIKVIIGSTRAGRFSEHPAAWIAALAKAHPEFDVETLDLKDYPMPLFDEAASPAYREGIPGNPVAAKWEAKIAEADGFIMVTPEYNHGTSAVLKNAIDWTYHAWNNKIVGFVAYGSVGGARAVEQLRQVAVEVQMASVRNAVHINAPWLLTENNSLKAGAFDSYKEAAEGMLSQLSWWTRALKNARAGK